MYLYYYLSEKDYTTQYTIRQTIDTSAEKWYYQHYVHEGLGLPSIC